MKRTFTALLLTLCFFSISFAQEDEASEKTRKALAAASKNGNELRSQISVNRNVSVKAVLIPRIDAKRIFGGEIANNYAVIALTVGNKSPDAALIIHGVFIDYREWPLSGAAPEDLSVLRSRDAYEASSFPHQVASEEYRLVRGQLLDAQTDSFRNRFMRWLTLAGNLAGAFTFSINEQGIVKGIAAATGVGIPGVATAWPDKTIDQLNRVSDFGFRTNKVIPKEGSDIVVCFFPIDRFLTPGFRKLFLKSPALFFAPLQMLVDKTVKTEADAALGDLFTDFGFNFQDLKGAFPCYMAIRHSSANNPAYGPCLNEFGLEITKNPETRQNLLSVKVQRDGAGNEIKDASGRPVVIPAEFAKFKKFMGLEFLGSVSLNRVTITVDGVMSVDVNTIASRIDEVEMTKLAECGNADGECFWQNVLAAGGVRTGVIRGAYLDGGELEIAGSDSISDVKVIDGGSSADELRFSFKLSKPVPTQTKLAFTVIREEAATETRKERKLSSNTWVYLVDYFKSAVAISDATVAATTLTVKGNGFKPVTGASPMTVSLHSQDGVEVSVPAANITFTDATQFTVNLTGVNLRAVCWHAQVNVNGLTSNQSDWFLATQPAPELDSAVHNGKFIFLKGKDLVNLSHCGGPRISFRLTQAGAASIALTVQDWSNGAPVLVLPEPAKTGAWKVEVLKDGAPLAAVVEAALTARP